uniref:Isoform 3 of Polyamine-modulated factor 1-binding protein 1 n=1 Tax=Homo sapiens TaxID=9606 RepID=Q8TBY8-3
MKDEAGERDREVSSLNSKLLSLQLDIKNLHDVCKRQRKTLQDNQLCMEEAMNSSHDKKQAQALAFEESEVEFGSSKQCHLRQLQQLKKKLLVLQQELEFHTEELQTSYYSLRQYQSILEKQTSDLVLLHHHCKLKEDEVILYEEEMGNHNENTGEKLHLAQEQLALAGDKIASLERSLNLYRDKYQSSLSNIELLECQVKMLQGELGGIMGQEPENKGDHSKVRIYTSPCMIQEHQETQKRLSEVWQKVSQQDDLIQELRNKLACSNALVLEREKALIKLQADFASCTATHRYPPSSSEECEDIKKILKHLQEQKDSQCLHVEEYQNLVKDLRVELEAVSEQKRNIMKDMMKLELDLHGLREETSAHIERKDKDITILQCRLQELQLEFTETQKLTLKKDKFLQEKDEMLQELEKKLTQVQNSLLKKEKELEKQQCMATELEMTVKEAKQDKSKEAECKALQAEVQKLKNSLEEAKQQERLAAQQAAQCKEEAALAGCHLEDTQRKLQKHYLQTTITKEAYDALSRKSAACQDDLTQALEKLNHVTSETKSLQQSLTQTQEKKAQLEEEIIAYEERMKKLNTELRKLRGFHQESELEVHAFDKKLEEMSCQVLQWQKQHQNDLKMLAAKEEQLREFQEEMAALKENLLEDDKEPCCLPQWSVPKDTCRLYRGNDQIMTNLEQWAKQQKVANEKLGNQLREQVKYIAKLSGEKDHLHSVMVHLQQENKKLKKEIEEKKMKAENTRLCTKALGPSRTESTQREKVCGTLGWKGLPQDMGQRMDLTKYIGMPHCPGSSYC